MSKFIIQSPFDKRYITKIVTDYQSKRGRWPTNLELSPNRAKAQAFSEQEIDDLREWLNDHEYEAIELAEDELMARSGQPRLPFDLAQDEGF